ncbi:MULTISPECIES: cytochrome c-type biogenesis protein [Rhodomicrobium]|uniref:cytochrome c-type biogenesis protein n=1 Tax=Rhodomicrobium TaxID=1068 RepID=UPI000B4AC2F2|nr:MULTISPECIES: cytochrome c-type biogenesis protein [Rhodomicrobium]
MKHRLLVASFLLCALAASRPSLAVEPSEVLADPALELRARNLSQHLRCVVCQNQSIDDSNAPLARDLRVLLRERLQAGDSDEAANAYIVARYGNFVLLKPPVQINTLLLWFGPALIFMLALFAGWSLVRRRPGTAEADASPALTEAERKALQSILKESPTA